MGLCDSAGRVRIGMALEQALLNALCHGNLQIASGQSLDARESLMEGKQQTFIEQRRAQEPYASRRIHVNLCISPEEARFVIRDEGPGFDTSALPPRDDPRVLEAEGGRGLVLMRSFMDEVTFNEPGNEVTMIKRREQVVPPAG
jgi:hypothetical protein